MYDYKWSMLKRYVLYIKFSFMFTSCLCVSIYYTRINRAMCVSIYYTLILFLIYTNVYYLIYKYFQMHAAWEAILPEIQSM